MRRQGAVAFLLLLLLFVQLAWGEQVSLSIPDALSMAQMGSVNSNADTAAPGAGTTTGSLSISEAAKGTEAIPSVNDVSSAPFQLSDHKSVADALSAYAAWHNRTLADPAACKETGVLVWTATAGFGDSVNALTTAFRYALTNGRMFFIQWQSKNDKQLWKIGLQQPGFHWDYADTLASYPGCRLSLSALRERAAHERVQGRPGKPAPPPARILAIAGSIVASHPLAGSMDALYQQGGSLIWGLTDRTLQRFLLRPNAELQSWIDAVVQGELARSESDPPDFAGVIGVQVRSGYADAAEVARRPSNANFLAPGDEERFVAAVETILRSPRFGADPRRAKVFLTTDSPDVRSYIENALRSERFSAKALASGPTRGATADAAATDNGIHSVLASTTGHDSASAVATDATASSAGRGLQVVSVRSGTVAHCGPLRSTDAPSVLRMLTEWFILSRHVDYGVVTAWSLFGASAVEGMSENVIHRIDASNCGQPGAKPCQRG